MYVLEGEIDYFYKDVDTGEIEYLKVREGDNIFTPDNELHATYSGEDPLIVSSKFPRDQETYEKARYASRSSPPPISTNCWRNTPRMAEAVRSLPLSACAPARS